MPGWIKSLWGGVKRVVFGSARQAWAAFQSAGFDDIVATLALEAVEKAQAEFSNNAARREWVVALLMGKGVPENVARGAVEAAVALLRKRAGA
jgi:hypothetical protein